MSDNNLKAASDFAMDYSAEEEYYKKNATEQTDLMGKIAGVRAKADKFAAFAYGAADGFFIDDGISIAESVTGKDFGTKNFIAAEENNAGIYATGEVVATIVAYGAVGAVIGGVEKIGSWVSSIGNAVNLASKGKIAAGTAAGLAMGRISDIVLDATSVLAEGLKNRDSYGTMAEKLLVTQFAGLGMEHPLGKVTRVTAGSLLAQNEEILRIVAKDAEDLPPLVNGPYIRNGKPHGRPRPRGAARVAHEAGVEAQAAAAAAARGETVYRDPNSGRKLNWKGGQPRKGLVDLGHVPGQEYRIFFEKYRTGKIVLDDLKIHESTAANFQLEGTYEKRSRKYERKDGK